MRHGTQEVASPGKIRVLIVDDSTSVRRALSDIIKSAPDLEVMAVATDPYMAVEKMRKELPDVIFLDLEMPRMDGLTFLRKIMSQRPIPVVICSTLTEEGSDASMQAFAAGAVEVIAKPRVTLAEARMQVCDAACVAARARVGNRTHTPPPVQVNERQTADVILPPPPARRAALIRTDPIVAIGASTGGTEALASVLAALPPLCPGIVIVQHMPEGFTAAFARRLDNICAITVREASQGALLVPGQALIAPGNRHTLIERVARRYRLSIREGPRVSRHRPSVDVLFRSAARAAGANALGVIMTGMGDDGARGLLEMQGTGARTIAQDEASCIVFGMPKEAIARGGAGQVLDLDAIAKQISNWRGGGRGLNSS